MLRSPCAVISLLVSALVFMACRESDRVGRVPNASFESDDPRDFPEELFLYSEPIEDTSATPVIAQTDALQIVGERLYALAPSALTVVDSTEPDALRVLGRYELDAAATMHVIGEAVVVVSKAPSRPAGTCAAEAVASESFTRVTVLDARDPKRISAVFDEQLQGLIVDTQRAGDAVYLVRKDSAPCYRQDDDDGACVPCGSSLVRVAVLDLSNPHAPQFLQEQAFNDEEYPHHPAWSPTVAFAAERIYVALPRTGRSSTVQVIDIATADRQAALRTRFEVEGYIASPRQLNEHDGVLRVSGLAASVLQTFEIAASGELTPLGRLELEQEDGVIDSVWFDGERAFAVARSGGSPSLTTLDLSDEARPRRVGKVELPSYVLRVEARGDRVLALSRVDTGQGHFQVLLLDVSELSRPKLIDRLDLDGSFSQLFDDARVAEYAFSVLEEQGRILVSLVDETLCTSGVHLIDFADDALELRGVAELNGAPRRALLQDDRLIAATSQTLEIFDIEERRALERLNEIWFAAQARLIANVGEHVVRVNENVWNGAVRLEVLAGELGTFATVVGEVELHSTNNASGCKEPIYPRELRVHGTRVHVRYLADDWWHVSTVDISKLARLQVSDESLGDGYTEESPRRSEIKGTEHHFVTLDVGYEWRPALPELVVDATIAVLDVSDLEMPIRGRLSLPPPEDSPLLHTRDDVVYVSRLQQTDTQAVRFLADQIDISDASAPQLKRSVPVPGKLVALLADRRMLTMSYRHFSSTAKSDDECRGRGGRGSFREGSSEGTACQDLERTLHLVRVENDQALIEDSIELDRDLGVVDGFAGDDTFFLRLRRPFDPAAEDSVLVLSATRSGTLEVNRIVAASDSAPLSSFNFIAAGQRLVGTNSAGDGLVLDATDPRNLVVRRFSIGGAPLATWVDSEHAYVSVGDQVRAIELESLPVSR